MTTAGMLLTALALGTTGVGAQQDESWVAFEGCWAPVVLETGGMITPAHKICVRENGAGAMFTTYVNGSVQSERLLIADAADHAVSESGCSGIERATWSADGRRIYIRSELTCGGAKRVSTTALGFVGAESFVDVQSVQVGSSPAEVRTVRYRLLTPGDYPSGFALPDRSLARETARLHAAAALELGDVIEASKQLHAPAVDALLAARRMGFAMDARDLRTLKSAGVATSTIDVMVALTYPEKFEVAAERPESPRSRVASWDPWLDSPRLGYGFYDPYRSYYSNCMGLGYYSSYMCDYRWGQYGYNYGSGGIWVVPVGTAIPTGDGGYVVPRGGTVSDKGYARGTQSTQGTARPRSGSSDRDSYPSRGSVGASSGGTSSGGSSTSSGTAGVGSSGASAGTGSTSTGQTAKPRGGGL